MKRNIDPLETTPGRLRAFAPVLACIVESGDWLQMIDAAYASPWFRFSLDRCPCCGKSKHQTGFARAGELVQGDITSLFQAAWMREFRKQEKGK